MIFGYLKDPYEHTQRQEFDFLFIYWVFAGGRTLCLSHKIVVSQHMWQPDIQKTMVSDNETLVNPYFCNEVKCTSHLPSACLTYFEHEVHE